MSEELGVQLKQKRESLGLNIEDVVEKTKLAPSVIRNIEEGELNKINTAYLKGFIKIYASFLGIEAHETLEKLGQGTTGKVRLRSGGKDVPEKKKNQSMKKSFPLLRLKRIIIFLCVGGVLFAGIWFVSRFVSGKIKNTPKVQKKFGKSVIVPEVKKQDKSGNFIPLKVSPSQKMSVSLTAKKSCFIKVKVDRKLLFEGVLNRGARENWQGKKEIELKISDGSAVYLEVNGKPYPSLTTMRKSIKSFKVTPSGISVEK